MLCIIHLFCFERFEPFVSSVINVFNERKYRTGDDRTSVWGRVLDADIHIFDRF